MANMELTKPAAKICSSSPMLRPAMCRARKLRNFFFRLLHPFSPVGLILVAVESPAVLRPCRPAFHHLPEQGQARNLLSLNSPAELRERAKWCPGRSAQRFQAGAILVLEAKFKISSTTSGEPTFSLHQKNSIYVDGQQSAHGWKRIRVSRPPRWLSCPYTAEAAGGRGECFVAGVRAANHLDRGLQRHRIHEMHAEHLRRPAGHGGDAGDRNSGRVGGEKCNAKEQIVSNCR